MKEYGKRISKYLIIVALIGMGTVLFGMSAAAWGNLLLVKDNFKFYLEQPITISEALAASRQNQDVKKAYQQGETETVVPLDFCIWGQKEDVMLSNDSLSRTVQANAVLLCGNPELLFADSRIPVLEDKQGCLVDEETAWELFGSSQVVGKEISCEGKTYTIRNVIAGKEKMIAFQVSNESAEEDMLNRITVRKTEACSASDLESIWLSQYNFSVKLLDLELLRGISGICLLLIPVTVCIFFGWYLYQQYRKQEVLLGKAVTAGAALLLVILLLFFLKTQIRIPDEYIPTRWSEFSFWSDLWERKLEGMRLLLQIPKADPDMEWMNDFCQTSVCGLLAEVVVVVVGILIQHKGKLQK